MKKLFLILGISLLALVSYGQLTFADEGDAISITGGGQALHFSKSGLLVYSENDNIILVTGGRTYRYSISYIDTPSYGTVDSVYSVIAGWLDGTYVFTGGVTADSATIDWLTGDTAIFDYISGDTVLVNLLIWPDADDGAPIGTATVSFSDLFLAEGGVINWDNGDATLTQVSNVVTLAGADLKITTPGTAATSVATIDGTQELDNKTIDAAVGKGTWTASGTWTLPAVTLGGVVSGGGQQLNNIIIGTVTPLAGTFTTATATKLTDGTGVFYTGALTGFDTISCSSLLTNGTFKALAGVVTGVTSITSTKLTDGTGVFYTGALTGFDTISCSSLLTNGTFKALAGVVTGATSITSTKLTDGTGVFYTGALTGFDTISCSSLLTNGTFKALAGVVTGATSVTSTRFSDGTGVWYTGSLQSFDTILSSSLLGNGTFKALAGVVTGATSITSTKLTDGTGVFYTGALTGFDTISGTLHTGTTFKDATLTITAGNISSANLIGADTVTANYFSGGQFYLAGDGTPTYFLTVITDTLCSVRTGIDTVRLHPPR